MNRPADVVVFEHEAVFDALWEIFVVLAEAIQGRGFVAEDAAEVQDHYCIAVLLGWELKQGEEFGMVI